MYNAVCISDDNYFACLDIDEFELIDFPLPMYNVSSDVSQISSLHSVIDGCESRVKDPKHKIASVEQLPLIITRHPESQLVIPLANAHQIILDCSSSKS